MRKPLDSFIVFFVGGWTVQADYWLAGRGRLSQFRNRNDDGNVYVNVNIETDR